MFPATEHYIAFKRQLGHTNHDLVTILIGLEAVGEGKVVKPSDFPANWNPKDIKASATRARRFARMATIAWAVDCLDSYICDVAKDKCYLSRPDVFDRVPETKSVFRRLTIFQEYFALKTDIPLSLAHLMIQWRNNLLHSAAENNLDAVYSGKLKNATEAELENFRHLDCRVMLDNFKKGEVPTLKEVGGAVQAINLLAGALDRHVGGLVDWPRNFDRRLRQLALPQRSTVKRIWSERDSAVRSRSIRMLLATAGIVPKAASTVFDSYLTSLEALTVEAAVDRYSTKIAPMRIELPLDYRAYFESDEIVVEGFTNKTPEWVSLWDPDEIEKSYRERKIATLVPGFLGFGTNGKDEIFAFDRNGAVYSFPVVDPDIRHAIKIADSWTEFKSHIREGGLP